MVGPKNKNVSDKSVVGPSTSLEIEAQQINPRFVSLEVLDKDKGSLVNHFCVGEASNLKSGDLETSLTSDFEKGGEGIESEWSSDVAFLDQDANDETDLGVLLTQEKMELEFPFVEEGHGLELASLGLPMRVVES